MTDGERWYIVGALDGPARYAEVFAGGDWEFAMNGLRYFYRSHEAAEAAFLVRDSPSRGDRIVDGATFDTLRAMALADETMR